MERQPTSEASATPQRLSGLSYDEALAILDKGQGSEAPVRPSEPGRTWRGGRVALVALTVVGVTAGVGLLGQASHRVLDCPVAPSPWRPDCAAVRTADAPVSPSRPPSGATADGAATPGAATVESTPRRRSVVARGTMKAQDAAAAPAPVATPSPSVAESDEEKPAYTLSTALPPPERGLKGELRPSLVPDALAPAPPSPRPAPRLARPDESKRPAIADRAPVAQTAVIAEPTRPSSAARPTADARPAADARPVAGSRPVPGARLAFDAPEQARLPTARRPEAAREEVKVAARTELPAVEALRQPPVPPIRPGAVERTARVTAGPAPTTSASRAPLAEPVTEPRSRLPRAGDEPAPRNIRRGGVAPRSDERLDGFPREFAQALREHNRRSATPRPDLDRPGGFPREFVQVLRDHNMAYSADPGGRRLGW